MTPATIEVPRTSAMPSIQMLSGSVARHAASTHFGRRRSSSLPTDLTSASTPQPERGVELASLERATASLSKACGGFARRARG
eukprot:5820956-Prymnesium_polylepis.1